MTTQTAALQGARTLQAGDLIDERETAAILDVKPSTLQNWRWKGKGPRFRKIGNSVRYHRADIAAFVNGAE